jgi:hypothetical protein
LVSDCRFWEQHVGGMSPVRDEEDDNARDGSARNSEAAGSRGREQHGAFMSPEDNAGERAAAQRSG